MDINGLGRESNATKNTIWSLIDRVQPAQPALVYYIANAVRGRGGHGCLGAGVVRLMCFIWGGQKISISWIVVYVGRGRPRREKSGSYNLIVKHHVLVLHVANVQNTRKFKQSWPRWLYLVPCPLGRTSSWTEEEGDWGKGKWKEKDRIEGARERDGENRKGRGVSLAFTPPPPPRERERDRLRPIRHPYSGPAKVTDSNAQSRHCGTLWHR